MKDLIIVYEHRWVIDYVRKKVDEVNSIITDTDKLEQRIYRQLASHFGNPPNKISKRWVKQLIDRDISQMLKQYRIQKTTSYSDLAITNDFGESLMYEPVDDTTNVELEVERKSLQRKIARLASDDFESYVLTAWSLGERSVDIARDLAIRGNHDVAYYKLKVARFKKRFKKQWNVTTFTKALGVNVS